MRSLSATLAVSFPKEENEERKNIKEYGLSNISARRTHSRYEGAALAREG